MSTPVVSKIPAADRTADPKTAAVEARVAEAVAAHRRKWVLTSLRGKKPVLRDWTNRPVPTEDGVVAWARQGNVGLRTGRVSGVVVVDVDEAKGGRLDDVPITVTIETGGGGRHLYFRAPEEPLGNSVSKLAPQVDVRADGGQVVYVGSIHPETKQPYRWASGLAPDEVPLAPFPDEWLIKLRGGNGQSGAIAADDLIPEGARNTTLTSLAGAMRRHGATGETIAAALDRENEARCDPPLPGKEVETITRSVARYPPAPDAFHLTDLGNAERFARDHGARVRFVHDRRRWHVWTESHWAPDADAEVTRLARETVRRTYAAVAAETDPDKRAKLAKHAAASESENRLRAMVTLAASEKGIAATSDAFDRDPWLLNVANGTLDLRTGALREHRPADLISHVTTAAHDPRAKAPRWTRFLREIFKSDEDLIQFVQRAVGYSLTGSTREQVFFLCYGTGGNGKTKFLEVLRALLGDLAQAARFESFLLKRTEGIPNDVARMRGARVVTASEAPGERRLSEATVKELTGGDTICARFLFQEGFEFAPTFKLWLSANHRPEIHDTSWAMWRRVRLLPFTVTIPEAKRDLDLAEKLHAELPGILAWAVEGCLAWGRDGLGAAAAVEAATTAYRSDSDVLADFLAAECEIGPKRWALKRDVYSRYVDHCLGNGERTLSKKAFSRRLQERGGIGADRGGKDHEHRWLGLGLVPRTEPKRKF